MKSQTFKPAPRGLVSISVVVGLSLLLFALLLGGFRRALVSQEIERTVQLQVDYGQREDAMLRSVIAQVPEAAIGIMQDGTASGDSSAFRWRSIFGNASAFANADSSTSDGLLASINQPNAINVNVGDQSIDDYRDVVSCIGATSFDTSGMAYLNSDVRDGINAMGSKLPPRLGYDGDSITESKANNYVFLSPDFYYETGQWAGRVESASTLPKYRRFNSIPYPNIHFGAGAFGHQPDALDPQYYFIARHNWWAFDVDFSAPNTSKTDLAAVKKQYMISLYEVPSQSAISSATAAEIRVGKFNSGTTWGSSINVAGGINGSNLRVEAGGFDGIAAKSKLTLDGGGATGVADSYYTGASGRESFEVDNSGKLLPISLAADSGRVAFVPVNVGNAFYDLFYGGVTAGSEADVLGDWKWSEYSRGAGRCDMQVTVTAVSAGDNQTPTEITFKYRESDGDFSTPIIYAKGGGAGTEEWPEEGTTAGDAFPFHVTTLSIGDRDESYCLVVNPERLKAFIEGLGGSLDHNRSLVVNPDYANGLNVSQPADTPVDGQMVVILRESEDLTDFETGFSLVTNLRLYIDSNVNQVSMNAPTGVGYTGTYYPPVSIFAPEVRYGATTGSTDLDFDGRKVVMGGSSGPLDLLQSDGATSEADVTANLTSIKHPADLPPISMMNWLILAEPVE